MTDPLHTEPGEVTQAIQSLTELVVWLESDPNAIHDLRLEMGEDGMARARNVFTRTAAKAASRAREARLREALAELVKEYVCNVDCTRLGGFYLDPEKEDVVIEARAALTASEAPNA